MNYATANSDYNHLAHVRVVRQIQKFMCYCTVLPCFILNLRAISKYQAPEGLYSEGRFNGGILGYEFRGLTHGGAYFRNFKVFNLYNQLRILQTFTEKDTNNLHNSSRIKSGFLEDRA